MIPLLSLFALCVVLQQLYIGQTRREIISVTKLIAATTSEPGEIATSIPDARDNFVVHFNISDPNGAAHSHTSVQTNYTAGNSTNTTEAFVRGTPHNDSTAWTRKRVDFFAGVVCNKTEAFIRRTRLIDNTTWAREHCDFFAGVMGDTTEAFILRKQRKANNPRTRKDLAVGVVLCILVLCLLIVPFWDLIPEDLLTFSASYADSMEQILRKKDDENAKLLSDNKELGNKYKFLLKERTKPDPKDDHREELLSRIQQLEEKNGTLETLKELLEERTNSLEKMKELLEERNSNLEKVKELLEEKNSSLEKEKQQLKEERDSVAAEAQKLIDLLQGNERGHDSDDSDDDDTEPPTGPSEPPSGPSDSEGNDGGGDGSTDSNGADRGGDASPKNGGTSSDGPDENDSPSSDPNVQSPRDNEPEEPTTSPTTTSDPCSMTKKSRPHGSQSKPVPTGPRNGRDEELRRMGAPSAPKSMRRVPVDNTLGNPNHRFRFIPPRPHPRGQSGKFKTFPNCPPGPLKPSNQSQPPPSTPGKPDFTIQPDLGSLFHNRSVGPGPK